MPPTLANTFLGLARTIYIYIYIYIYTPYMTVYLVISMPKIPYMHRIYTIHIYVSGQPYTFLMLFSVLSSDASNGLLPCNNSPFFVTFTGTGPLLRLSPLGLLYIHAAINHRLLHDDEATLTGPLLRLSPLGLLYIHAAINHRLLHDDETTLTGPLLRLSLLGLLYYYAAINHRLLHDDETTLTGHLMHVLPANRPAPVTCTVAQLNLYEAALCPKHSTTNVLLLSPATLHILLSTRLHCVKNTLQQMPCSCRLQRYTTYSLRGCIVSRKLYNKCPAPVACNFTTYYLRSYIVSRTLYDKCPAPVACNFTTYYLRGCIVSRTLYEKCKNAGSPAAHSPCQPPPSRCKSWRPCSGGGRARQGGREQLQDGA